MTPRLTLAIVRCGFCGRLIGFKRWPPTDGKWIVTTHGLCSVCLAAIMERYDAEDMEAA